jgi:hypothetical protein
MTLRTSLLPLVSPICSPSMIALSLVRLEL